jgi:hypothetical protein
MSQHRVAALGVYSGEEIQVLIPDVCSVSDSVLARFFGLGHFKTDPPRSKIKLHTHLYPAQVQLLSLARACCTLSKIGQF